jgi:exosortase/archaeosortase family protein
VLRLAWVQNHLLIPFAGLQQDFGCLITGAPRSAVTVDLSCTGSDAMALCLGAMLAVPVPWRRRLIGSAVGLGLVTALNTARIGSLSLAAGGDADTFRFLHVYVWPTALVVITAGYVFLWMASAGVGASGRPSLWPLSRSAMSRRLRRVRLAP